MSAPEGPIARRQNRGPGGAKRSVGTPRLETQVRGFSDSSEVSVPLRHSALPDAQSPPNEIPYDGRTRSTLTPAAVAILDVYLSLARVS